MLLKDQLAKGSYEPLVVAINDLFSYRVNKQNEEEIISLLVDNVQKIIENAHLIETLFKIDHMVALQDMMVNLYRMFGRSKITTKLKNKLRNNSKEGTLYLYNQMIEGEIDLIEDSSLLQLYQTLQRQMIVEAQRSLIKLCVKDIKQPVFIALKSFDYTLLYQLDSHIKGFIIKEPISEYDELIAEAYHMPVLYEKPTVINQSSLNQKPKYRGNDIHIYLSLVDARDVLLIQHDWYHGIVFHSEYMLVTQGLMVSVEEVFQAFDELFHVVKGKPIYLEIPNFNDENQLIIDPDLRTEVHHFSITNPGLKPWFDGLIKAINKHHPQLTFFIPNINSEKDIHYWEEEIAVILEHVKTEIPIKLGMAIETEAALQYCEDFTAYQMVVIKLEQLMIEYDAPYFTDDDMDFLIDDLKMAHYIFRVKQPKTHILTGKSIIRNNMLRKFINMGFRQFSVPIDMLTQIESIIYDWEDTRGRYIKKEDA